MIYNLVEHYSDIVAEYEVFDFRRYGTARALDLHTAEGIVLPSQLFSLDRVLETIAARLRG